MKENVELIQEVKFFLKESSDMVIICIPFERIASNILKCGTRAKGMPMFHINQLVN